jgi:hypothetical protein
LRKASSIAGLRREKCSLAGDLSVAILVAALLGGCEERAPKPESVSNPDIVGEWRLSERYNNLEMLKYRRFINDDEEKTWLKIYVEKDLGILYRTDYDLEKDSDNNVEVCDSHRIVWNPQTRGNFRDFLAVCSLGSDGRTRIFGDSDFGLTERTLRYNFRVFGEGFNHMRFVDADGFALYFKRVNTNGSPYYYGD